MTAATLLLARLARSCRGTAALAQLRHERRPPPSWPSGPSGDGRASASSTSGLLGRRAAIAPLGHELVELFLVLGHAQPTQELAKFALLLFQPLQRLGGVRIEEKNTARRH